MEMAVEITSLVSGRICSVQGWSKVSTKHTVSTVLMNQGWQISASQSHIPQIPCLFDNAVQPILATPGNRATIPRRIPGRICMPKDFAKPVRARSSSDCSAPRLNLTLLSTCLDDNNSCFQSNFALYHALFVIISGFFIIFQSFDVLAQSNSAASARCR